MIYSKKSEFLKNCKNGKLLALDIGIKRIGIAMSDVNKMFAFPYETLIRKNIEYDFCYLKNIINNSRIVGIVVGLPLSFSDKETDFSQYVRDFIQKLSQNIEIPFYFQDERLTSFEAEELTKNYLNVENSKKNIDKIAASYILESFLEI